MSQWIIGIDPGTSCGWAVLSAKDRRILFSGVWDLKARRHEGGGMRFARLNKYLNELFDAVGKGEVQALFYEEVRRHVGVDAAHVYGGIIAVLSSYCEEAKVPYAGIPVATIKKHATGKGNAKKDAMVAAACERWGLREAAEDEADAIFVASAGLDTL